LSRLPYSRDRLALALDAACVVAAILVGVTRLSAHAAQEIEDPARAPDEPTASFG